MKHRAILNITYGVYELNEYDQMEPAHVHRGKALKTIDGKDLEDCIANVKSFCQREGFNLLREEGIK